MTNVKFYILPDERPDGRELLACRLIEKTVKLGHRIFVHTPSPAEAQRFDDLLWTFRDGSFIPHGRFPQDEDDRRLKVLIGHDTAPDRSNDILINLTGSVPEFFSRFQRVVEVIDNSDEQRLAGRERYKFYRDRGYELETHNI